MDTSVGSAIEQIKLQEQDKDIQLKEKRAFEATVMSLNRALRDTITQAEKSEHEHIDLLKTTDRLQAQLDVERVWGKALNAQVNACSKELEELRAKSANGISKVWELRKSLCETVQNVSDACDVWGLFIKPTCAHIYPQPTKRQSIEKFETDMIAADRLKIAIERRDRALLDRDRLLSEPEAGEEFIRLVSPVFVILMGWYVIISNITAISNVFHRIKNALRYSVEMAASLK